MLVLDVERGRIKLSMKELINEDEAESDAEGDTDDSEEAQA